MAAKQSPPDPASVAKQTVAALGRGYDVTNDLWLKSCKSDSLIELDKNRTQDLLIPGDIVIHGVPASFKCDKGDRTRFRSDILSFKEMSEKFSQSLSIPGKIPLGLFNYAFNLSGIWQKDASTIKTLAMDGVFINLYSLELLRTQLILKEEVKRAVPSSWDPAALANFVEKYGTHVIVGVKIGGKDVIYLKQESSSPLSSVGVQKCLEAKAKERFPSCQASALKNVVNKGKISESFMVDQNGIALDPMDLMNVNGGSLSLMIEPDESVSDAKGLTFMCKRKGGLQFSQQSHNEWLKTVPLAPDVISMSFVPITSLLNGVVGSGFLTHAINLYLRYKPRTMELHHFLEFQLPKEWAPAFSDLPLGPPKKQSGSPSLQFRLLGPKLQINTTPVIVGKRPVTGLRLYLEGKKSNRLAIHVQYLTVVPQVVQPLWGSAGGEEEWKQPDYDYNRYFEPVLWKSFSHVCTAPVEYNEDAGGVFVVIGAQLQVEEHGTKKVLFLTLCYSRIPKAKTRREEWDHTPASQQKSGIFSTLISTAFSSNQQPSTPAPVVLNSGVYHEGPPGSGQVPKLLKFVDTREMIRGPHDTPGYWLVTGARLFLDNGKISVRVKYSLLLYNVE